jgi:hypothetical protein
LRIDRGCWVGVVVELPNDESETNADSDVEGREPERFADAYLVIFAIDDAEVESKQRHDCADERKPDPVGLAEKLGGEKCIEGVHRLSVKCWRFLFWP